MHEMQSIVTDVRGGCLSVCLSVTWLISASLCKTDQEAVRGERLWGFMEHCDRHWPRSPTERESERGVAQFLGPPPICGTTEAMT